MSLRRGLVLRMSTGHFISVIYTVYQAYEFDVIEEIDDNI